MTFKNTLKLILPPVALRPLRFAKDRLLRPDNTLTYAPEGWDTSLPAGMGQGYDCREAVENECRDWEPRMEILRRRPLDLTRIFDDRNKTTQRLEDYNNFATFGYVLSLASLERQTLRVLDYGGCLGHYYLIARALLPDVVFDYHCKELPAMANEGKRVNPQVKWHTDDSCLSRPFDLIMFSIVLTYIRDWKTLLRRASGSTTRYLYIQEPAIERTPSYLSLQKFRGAAMLYQSFNKAELCEAVQSTGLRLIREFWFGEHIAIREAPEQSSYCGWLFEKPVTPQSS
jgi:putative methyltransferase (TIGR04325 family)